MKKKRHEHKNACMIVTHKHLRFGTEVDERGGRSTFGVPFGRALAEEYELEHDDERVFPRGFNPRNTIDEEGFVPFPK